MDVGASLRDRHGRRIDYARISITDACDYRCVFCSPRTPRAVAGPRLDTAETLRLCRVLAEIGVSRFKLTGGEPFMNPDAVNILAHLKRGCRAKSVTVTTNASTLAQRAPELRDAGVDGVNVSLAGIDPGIYAAATRSRVEVGRVLDGVVLAKKLGLAVKLNMVPIRGLNDADILPLLEFAMALGVTARFIELMPLGEARRFRGVDMDEVREVVESRFGPLVPVAGREGNGPATYFRAEGHAERIGFIAALSRGFCRDCNRVRLTASGFLKTCLHHDHGCDLAAPLRNGDRDADIARRIRAAVADKPERHLLSDHPGAASPRGEPMYRIGG